jgi:hypothetical protein
MRRGSHAARQLGLPYDADALPDLCANLRGRGCAAWANRLEAAASRLRGE